MPRESKPAFSVDTAYSALARDAALVHSLQVAHASNRWNSSDPDPALLRLGQSPQKQESIAFNSCGSYAANKVDVRKLQRSDAPSGSRSTEYVDKYLGTLDVDGTPQWFKRTMGSPSKGRPPGHR